MTTTTQTIQDFYAILNTNPDDWETRLVLADAYEEMPFVTSSDGVVRRGSVYADGQRWQVESGAFCYEHECLDNPSAYVPTWYDESFCDGGPCDLPFWDIGSYIEFDTQMA